MAPPAEVNALANLLEQLNGSGWRDRHGHPIEQNVAFQAAREVLARRSGPRGADGEVTPERLRGRMDVYREISRLMTDRLADASREIPRGTARASELVGRIEAWTMVAKWASSLLDESLIEAQLLNQQDKV